MNQPNEPADSGGGKKLSLHQLIDLLGDISDYEADPDLNLVELSEGEILFAQGDEGDSAYILIAGMLGVRVTQPDGSELVIDRLVPGALVGEMALLSGQTRSATVFALNDAGLICLDKSKFEQMAAEDEEAMDTIDASVGPRWQRLQLANILKDLLGELDTASLHALQNEVEWLHASNGDIIFKQGDSQDGMYIVVNGRLGVTLSRDNGEEEAIGEIGPGETVGEFALITDEARSSSVHAVRETNLIKISPSLFWRLAADNPEFMGNITRIIVERQQQSLKGVFRPGSAALTIALLPASPRVDVWQFAQELEAGLSAFGSVTALNGPQCDLKYGLDGVSQLALDDPKHPAIAAWMDDLEAAHQYVLFVADPDPSNWTRRCIGQADRVLIIAHPDEDPQPGPAEKLLAQLEVPVRTELVLWHPASTEQPQDTAAWLDVRQVTAHHHLRQSDQAHLSRLARRLSGHAISLVLSGGGARGFTQMGTYRALLELGIPLDYVGGTSFGAVMAGVFTLGLDYDEAMSLASNLASSGQIFDYTLPITSLAASKKVTRICQEVYGQRRIEDLWLPFFCVSTNLSRAEPVIHRRGLLWRAIRSSLSIPAVFAPVIEDGEIIVDGGPMNNFPAEVMCRLSESDHVVGVQASPHRHKKRDYDYDTNISGWRILLSRINPFSKPLRSPSLIATILRAQDVNSAYNTKMIESIVDLLIKMDVRGYGFLDFGAYKPIAQAGYEASIGPLREWQERRLSNIYSK